MSGTQEEGYIRGAAADGVDGRKVLAAVAAVVLVAMLALTAYLFSTTSSANTSASDLARSGMTVTATVTGCEGISDGVGMGIEYYDCKAQVSSGGRTLEGLLHGSRVLRPTGSQVLAMMVPGDISTLTVDRARPASYLPAWIMAVASLVLLGVLVLFVRGRLFRRPAPVPPTT